MLGNPKSLCVVCVSKGVWVRFCRSVKMKHIVLLFVSHGFVFLLFIFHAIFFSFYYITMIRCARCLIYLFILATKKWVSVFPLTQAKHIRHVYDAILKMRGYDLELCSFFRTSRREVHYWDQFETRDRVLSKFEAS